MLRENDYLVLFIPASKRALVFRVLSLNGGYYKFNYGPLPITSGTTLSTITGSTVTVPADGVLPGYAIVNDLMFPYTGVYDPNDMWFVPADEFENKLIHAVHRYTPSWIRVETQIPIGVSQARFQGDRLIGGVTRDFGFRRGTIEVFHIPEVHYGFYYVNDTNMDVNTYVSFTYAEIDVVTPDDPSLIYAILTKRVNSYWYTLPVVTGINNIEDSLRDSYGYTGFPVDKLDKREEALDNIREILNSIRR